VQSRVRAGRGYDDVHLFCFCCVLNKYVGPSELCFLRKCTCTGRGLDFIAEMHIALWTFCISYRNTKFIFGILYFLQKYKCHFWDFVFLTEIQMSFFGFCISYRNTNVIFGFCISYRNTNVIFGVLYFLQKYKCHIWGFVFLTEIQISLLEGLHFFYINIYLQDHICICARRRYLTLKIMKLRL
jgi:hypothetical protein